MDYNMPSNYPTYPNSNIHQPLHINANGQQQQQRLDEQPINRFNTGLLREDIMRHAQNNRNEEIMMRYPSTNNVRIQEAQIQASSSKYHDEFDRGNEMRTSKSEDMLRQQQQHAQNDMMRYASSGNIRTQESSKIELPQLRLNQEMNNTIRGTAKLMEMGEEVRRRQNRPLQQHQSYQHLPTTSYYQQSQNYYPPQPPPQHYANQTHLQNTHNLQNLNLNQPTTSPYYQQQHVQQSPSYYSNTSPNYHQKSPPIAPKPLHKTELPPELPPTSTHPLFNNNNATTTQSTKILKDPWAREEQERQAEVRREQARAWQEQQIRELMSIPNRTTQQEEQLRVLQLEREFQRRAMEAAEQDDDDTEKVCLFFFSYKYVKISF